MAGKNFLLVLGLVFVADAGWLELTGGDERRRFPDVEILGVDGEAQLRPSPPQLGRNRQADHAAADHRDRWPAHIAFERAHMIRDDGGAAEAQRDPGPAMSIVVDQKLRSVPARNDLVVELEANAARAMRSNADEIRPRSPQARQIPTGQYFSSPPHNKPARYPPP